MSKQQGRTLVVDLRMLEASRDLFREMAKTTPNPADEAAQRIQAAFIDQLIKHGITVDLAPEKVAGWAKALCQVAEIREDIWQRAERTQERYYSEADAAADWTPSGGAA